MILYMEYYFDMKELEYDFECQFLFPSIDWNFRNLLDREDLKERCTFNFIITL